MDGAHFRFLLETIGGETNKDRKTQKAVRKHKKKKKKIRRTICSLNNEKTIKISFYCSKESGLLRTRKTQKTKSIAFPKHIFSVFCFQEQKIIIEITTKQALNFLYFST